MVFCLKNTLNFPKGALSSHRLAELVIKKYSLKKTEKARLRTLNQNMGRSRENENETVILHFLHDIKP